MQIRLSLPPQPPFLFLLWTDPTVSRVHTRIPNRLCYILALCPAPVGPRPDSLSCTGLALIAYADQSSPENCSSPLGHMANPAFPGRPSLLLWSFPTLSALWAHRPSLPSSEHSGHRQDCGRAGLAQSRCTLCLCLQKLEQDLARGRCLGHLLWMNKEMRLRQAGAWNQGLFASVLAPGQSNKIQREP